MILVTGGAGFVGVNLVLELNRRGMDVTICDSMVDYRANRTRNLQLLRYNDLINPWNLMEWLDGRKLDSIIHLGAITDTMCTDPEMFVTNYSLPVELFIWCTKNRVSFIYASSAAVYGAGLHGFQEDRYENHLRPLSYYGWSKLIFDRFVSRHGARRGDHPPSCVGLRLFNVYGPHEEHKRRMASMIHQMIEPISCGDSIVLFRQPLASTDLRRDFVYVDDVVAVILWFLERNSFGVFNVGTGRNESFETVAHVIADRFNVGEPRINYIDMPAKVRDQYQFQTRADLTKLRREGYGAEFLPIVEGIARMVRTDPVIVAAE